MFSGFLDHPSHFVAPRLLGCELHREIDGEIIRVKIVETESYSQSDQASHSYRGETPRNSVMFGPSGHLYVYFTYGMHYCCNIVTGKEGEGSAVLIRAVEPISGVEYIEKRRGYSGVAATNGPAKLCKALAIDKSYNGHDLRNSPLQLAERHSLDTAQIVTSTRLGISKEKEAELRWYIKDNPFVSKL